MIGLGFFLALIFYIGLALLVSYWIRRPFSTPKAKGIAQALTLLTFVFIPTWDIILGKLYFNHLCETEGGLKIYKTVEGVEGFYLDSADMQLVERLLVPNHRLNIFGRAQWLDGIHNESDVVTTPSETYRFIETGRDGSYYQYVLNHGRIVRNSVPNLISKYGRQTNTTDLASFLLNGGTKVEYIIQDLATKDTLAALVSISAFNGWLQAKVSPLLGRSFHCPQIPVIHEAVYFGALKPTESKRTKEK